MKRISPCILFFWICCTGFSAQWAMDGSWKEMSFTNASFPLYRTGKMQKSLTVLIRVDAGYVDYEKKGFFRLGVFPLAVLQGVRIEIPNPADLTNTLDSLHAWLLGKGAARLELRDVVFAVSSNDTNGLQCDFARLSPRGQLKLYGNVIFTHGQTKISALVAYLQLTGSKAGFLTMETTPPLTCKLLSWAPN